MPLDAIPYKAPEKGDNIVVRCTSADEDMLDCSLRSTGTALWVC